MVVAGDGEADSANASVEVEDVVGGDMLFNFGKGHLVDREVDLEETVGGVGVFVAEDIIGKVREYRVGLVVFVKAAGNFAILVTAEEERLIAASFIVTGIEVGNDFGGAMENFGALNTGLSNGDFTV